MNTLSLIYIWNKKSEFKRNAEKYVYKATFGILNATGCPIFVAQLVTVKIELDKWIFDKLFRTYVFLFISFFQLFYYFQKSIKNTKISSVSSLGY